MVETCHSSTDTCIGTWTLMTTGCTTGTGDPTLAPTGWCQINTGRTRDHLSPRIWNITLITMFVLKICTKLGQWKFGIQQTGQMLKTQVLNFQINADLTGHGKQTGAWELNVLMKSRIVVIKLNSLLLELPTNIILVSLTLIHFILVMKWDNASQS